MKENQIDRRRFLKSAALGAGAAWAVGARSEAAPAAGLNRLPPGKPVIFKAVQWSMIGEKLSIEDKFKLVRDLGFDGVEVDSPFGQDLKRLQEAAHAAGVQIHGVVDPTHWNFRLSDPDPKIRERALQDLLKSIRCAHALGGWAVLLVPGHGKDGTQEEVAERSLAQIQKALPLAARLGVQILVENVWNNFCYVHNGPGDQKADKLAAFIDRAHSPWVGSYFDIGNHRRYAVPSQWVRTLGLRIRKLHAKDYNHKTRKWADIGEGTVDWDQVRNELARLNYHGWATAEVGGGDRKRLATIKRQMDAVFGG
ncbi:MAG: sugar phosphate isomerase/epimerase [Verrucomicrobia bacterium]|nr:sugar phosphate isomerase/epimerase [Verrucomicrobiota bacterium]